MDQPELQTDLDQNKMGVTAADTNAVIERAIGGRGPPRSTRTRKNLTSGYATLNISATTGSLRDPERE
jgi:hypothetical protein